MPAGGEARPKRSRVGASASWWNLSISRLLGTAARMRAQAAITRALTLARLLNEPKVNAVPAIAGGGPTSGGRTRR
ncbi:MAG: hypothetical protein WDO24_27480 [Pseudomonadota bacterium]